MLDAWYPGGPVLRLGKESVPETNSEFTPENGWLEDDPFLYGWPIFRGYVSFRDGIFDRFLLESIMMPEEKTHEGKLTQDWLKQYQRRIAIIILLSMFFVWTLMYL